MYNCCCCLVILFFSAFLSTVFLVSSSSTEVLNQSNCSNEELKYAGNGSLEISLDKGCYIYTFIAKENSTIFGISVTTIPSNTTTSESEASGNVTVYLQELARIDESGIYVTSISWTLTPTETSKNYYFSRTKELRVIFMTHGNWSRNDIILSYQEIVFDTVHKNSSDDGSKGIKPWIPIEGRSYRPNCVYIFRIMKLKDISASNVMLTLNYLDIDVDVGEYLLIGAGTDPFEGTPPLFVTNFRGKKQYFVNDENAYIVFVSGSTRKNHKGFYITWEHTGTKINEEKEHDNEDVLESVPICIYNITAAAEEFKKSHDWFGDFRIKFADVASKYVKSIKNDSLIPRNENISPSSVSIFRVSGVIPINESSKALYVMVKISKESEVGKAAFKWHELEVIVDMYTEQWEKNEADKYQFRKCPTRKVPESWGNLGWYLIIPVMGCILLLAWNWKYNPISEYFLKKKRMNRASQQEMNTKYYQSECVTVDKSLAENPYTSLPKLQVTNIQGRRYTLNLADTLLNDADQSEDEIFNKIYTYRPQRNSLESFSMKQPNKRFSTKRPEINDAFVLDESSNELYQDDNKSGSQEEKFEHMYDSVKSTTCLRGEDEVIDTKL